MSAMAEPATAEAFISRTTASIHADFSRGSRAAAMRRPYASSSAALRPQFLLQHQKEPLPCHPDNIEV